MSDRDRLIELQIKAYKEWSNNTNKEISVAEFVTDYLLANGVIVPPCKVGDKIYQLDTAGDIYESEITQIVYDTKGVAFDERAIGKTVFLTKEGAGKALAERGKE